MTKIFIGKEQLARSYGYQSCSGFMRQLAQCGVLDVLVAETGYRQSQKSFSPRQVEIIVEKFGSYE